MIAIRPSVLDDTPKLADLMREMAGFYGAIVASGTRIEDDLPGHARTVDILVALDAEAVVGFATFAALFPVGGLVAFTYIQQVYVAAHARRRGIAERLLAAIAQTARDRGCDRIEWSTGADNLAARALYEGLGAIGSAKMYYVLSGDALGRLAAR